MKHFESRWLTLAPTALLWIAEKFDGLKQYFFIDVPANSKRPSLMYNKTYKKISDQIKCKNILTEIHCYSSYWYIRSISWAPPKGWMLNHILHWVGCKDLPGTRNVHFNQLHDKDLVFGGNCKSAFDVLSQNINQKF